MVVVVVVVLDDPSVLATVPGQEGEAAGEPQAPRRRHKPKVTRAPRVIRVGNAALYGKGPGMARKLAAPRGSPSRGEYGAMTDDFASHLEPGPARDGAPGTARGVDASARRGRARPPGPARLEAVKAVAARHPRQLGGVGPCGRARRRRGRPPMPMPASDITVVSTPSGQPDGVARAMSVGAMRPTGVSCAPSRRCAGPRRRSARPTRRSVAPSSSTSSTPSDGDTL